MATFKNILLMIIIGILFSVFTYSLGTAVMERPQYEDYCGSRYYPQKIAPADNCQNVMPRITEQDTCDAAGGRLEETYDATGCVTSYECNTCQAALDQAEQDFRLIIFLFMSILGVIAIVAALIIHNGNDTTEWILNGFLLGGLFSLFVSTIIYYADAPSLLRPIILLVELTIVIVVALRKTKEQKGKKKK